MYVIVVRAVQRIWLKSFSHDTTYPLFFWQFSNRLADCLLLKNGFISFFYSSLWMCVLVLVIHFCSILLCEAILILCVSVCWVECFSLPWVSFHLWSHSLSHYGALSNLLFLSPRFLLPTEIRQKNWSNCFHGSIFGAEIKACSNKSIIIGGNGFNCWSRTFGPPVYVKSIFGEMKFGHVI